MEGHEVDKNVIRASLEKAIYGVKCVGRKRRRVLVRMMQLVAIFVNGMVVQPTMNEVNQTICERKEEGDRYDEVRPSVLGYIAVET